MPKLSPTLEALIEKGLLDRLPVTFSTFFFEQMQDWDVLFPAEKSRYERLFTLLDRSDPSEVDRLFAPVRKAEAAMSVNEAVWPKRRFTLDQVDFLNRSPHYAEWRSAISGVFARLDPLLDAEIAQQGRPRLIVVLSPPELPVGPDRLWTRIVSHGKRIPLKPPSDGSDYLPLVLTGNASGAEAPSVADLYTTAKPHDPYTAWCIEAGSRVAAISRGESVVRFSYERLANYRARLMSDVQKIVEQEQIRGPRQLSARLKELRVKASEFEVAHDPVLAEFARAVLLSGNGTLLINNTFVEWATMQSIRRARPAVSIISYGIRNKVKPFSSLLIYTDQEAASPIPTQADMLGSYVDLEVFHQYVWQEVGKYAEYRNNTALLFIADGADELLAIAPPDFPLFAEKSAVELPGVFNAMKDWLSL
jgi:hypothetical protein